MTVDYARTDIYSPEVEAIGDMETCSDETHAHGCPCGVGGDAIEACFLCNRRDSGLRVIFEGRDRSVCSDCYYRDEVRIPLDLSVSDG